MTYVEYSRISRQNVWFKDIGYNNHMYGDSSLLIDLKNGFKRDVKLGDHTIMSVVGK